jgi:hypothetical protein
VLTYYLVTFDMHAVPSTLDLSGLRVKGNVARVVLYTDDRPSLAVCSIRSHYKMLPPAKAGNFQHRGIVKLAVCLSLEMGTF